MCLARCLRVCRVGRLPSGRTVFADDDIETHDPVERDAEDDDPAALLEADDAEADDAEALDDEELDDESLEDDELETEASLTASPEDESGARAAPASGGDEDESDQASLEELLAQRAAARQGSDDGDDGDIIAFDADDEPPPTVDIPARANPVKDDAEFVCNSCYLVKPRVQLADAARGLCRDCV